MKKFRIDDHTLDFIEASPIPFAVYQFVSKRVVTLALSAGFCELFGYKDRIQAYYDMDERMYVDTHPDDVSRISEAAVLFATRGGRYDVIYRSRNHGSSGYKLIHAVGEHAYTADGTRLAYVWYTDEGEYQDGVIGRQGRLNQSLSRAIRRESVLNDSFYDPLTGLPGMNYFFELAEAGRKSMYAKDKVPILLYIDLNGMKFYNQKYGFAEGDRLLQAFGRVLTRTFGHHNCGHLAQDHFVVLTEGTGVAETLQQLFADTRELNNGRSLPIRVGIYLDWTDEVSVATACDRAKIACDTLRSSYSSCFTYYERSLLDKEEHRQYILANLDRAIKKGWIQIYYQPIVRALNGRVSNEEALARWADPVKGVLSPEQFIPYLEDSGVSYKLDLYVLDRVLDKLKLQERNGLPLVPQSINLSRMDFDACDMVEEIRGRVDAAGISRSLITIEITESMVGSDFEFMKEQIARFQQLGFSVWMDDFGSGYSSLDVLQSIRFQLIKFDMRFLQSFDEGESGKIILTELMRMATALGTETVCEGVETREHVRFLQEIGCTKLQGFYFCRPIPLETILERYESGTQIGFENPKESAYFDRIGKVNLFDLGSVANGSDKLISNYFDTVPMGIIEVSDHDVRYIRYNHAFRVFMSRMFSKRPEATGAVLDSISEDIRSLFIQTLKNIFHEGNVSVMDQKMPDGSLVHFLLRPLAVNPVSDSSALAVAVLSVEEPKEGVSYSEIARALATDYSNLYYVDLDTEDFIEYVSEVGKEALSVERHGSDFFSTSRKDAMLRIYPEDLDGFLSDFTRENIIRELERQGSFNLVYRLMNRGTPVYASMKVMRIGVNQNHIIVATSNVDAQMKQQRALELLRQSQIAYTRITALSSDYICMYTVDPETEQYVEYNATSDYAGLGLDKGGEDFFRKSQEYAARVVTPEDLPRYRRLFTKKHVLKMIEKYGLFVMSYRLLIGGAFRQVGLRGALVQESDGNKLIIGVRDLEISAEGDSALTEEDSSVRTDSQG